MLRRRRTSERNGRERNGRCGEQRARREGERWPELWESLPPMILGRLVQIGISGLERPADVDAMDRFFAALPEAQLNSMRRNYQQGAESARNSIAWIAAQRDGFVAALVA